MAASKKIGSFLYHWKHSEIVRRNASADPDTHWDLTEGTYVSDPVEEGYHWDNDLYKMVPD